MEYRVVVDPDGTINEFPILTDTEREEKHQELLKLADKLIQKYKKKDKQG